MKDRALTAGCQQPGHEGHGSAATARPTWYPPLRTLHGLFSRLGQNAGVDTAQSQHVTESRIFPPAEDGTIRRPAPGSPTDVCTRRGLVVAATDALGSPRAVVGDVGQLRLRSLPWRGSDGEGCAENKHRAIEVVRLRRPPLTLRCSTRCAAGTCSPCRLSSSRPARRGRRTGGRRTSSTRRSRAEGGRAEGA